MGRTKKQVDPNLKPEELARQSYVRAIRLLAAREHSAHELRNKLGDGGFASDIVEATLAQLQSAGYQCDERFATLYAEQLLRKRQGPMAISAKLSARGIASAQAREAMQAAILECGGDWSVVAADALVSRFSSEQLANPDQAFMGKCARFLNRRGFSTTDSIKAIRLAAETVPE